MARTVITSDKIIEINERYYLCHNYSKVARELGIAASTVKKYVNPNYVPKSELKENDIDIAELRKKIESFLLTEKELSNPDILKVTDDEKEELKEVWEVLSI